jgi:RND family efflux transporter MFP subunit
LKQALVLPGETRGWYSSTIYARVTGYVARWLVDIGDSVKKDQVMAIIDTPDLDAQLDAAQAQLNAAEAEAKVKESDAEFAKTTYVRWQTSPKGAVSDQEREDKKARHDSSVAQLNAALARVNLDRANVDRLRYLTRFKEVSAPYDGVITERRIDIGDLVTAGSTNTTPLFGIAQFDRIRVFANIPRSARVDLGAGQTAHIRAAELPNRIFEGAITRTSESQDRRARTLRVEIDLPNDDRALVPDVYVQVAFDLASKPSIQVPAGRLDFPRQRTAGRTGHQRQRHQVSGRADWPRRREICRDRLRSGRRRSGGIEHFGRLPKNRDRGCRGGEHVARALSVAAGGGPTSQQGRGREPTRAGFSHRALRTRDIGFP